MLLFSHIFHGKDCVMAESHKAGSLSHTFMKAMHWGHMLMLAGMVVSVMASPAIALTVPNIVAATADAAWQMTSGLAELPSLFEQASLGDLTNFDLSYDWGAAAHGAHTGGAEALSGAAHNHAAHTASVAIPSAPQGLSPAQLQLLGQ